MTPAFGPWSKLAQRGLYSVASSYGVYGGCLQYLASGAGVLTMIVTSFYGKHRGHVEHALFSCFGAVSWQGSLFATRVLKASDADSTTS